MIRIAVVLVAIGCALAAGESARVTRQVLVQSSPVHQVLDLVHQEPAYVGSSLHYAQPAVHLQSALVQPAVHQVYNYAPATVGIPTYVRESTVHGKQAGAVLSGAVSRSSISFGNSQSSGTTRSQGSASFGSAAGKKAEYSSADSASSSSFNFGGSSFSTGTSASKPASFAAQKKTFATASSSGAFPSAQRSSQQFGLNYGPVSAGVISRSGFGAAGSSASSLSGAQSGIKFQFGNSASQQSFSSKVSGAKAASRSFFGTASSVPRFSASVAQPARSSFQFGSSALNVAAPRVAVIRSGSASLVGSSGLERSAAIVSQSGEISDDGSFSYGFQSDNGIQASASASVKSLGPEELAQVVQGSYSYTAPDGSPITVQYVADENGFHAAGDHLPTPPPIPQAIARSLEILPKLEEQEQLRKY